MAAREQQEMSSNELTVNDGDTRSALWLRALIAVLIALIVLGGAGAARLAAKLRDTRLFGASDSATILALAGVREFTERADLGELMLAPIGADSMVMQARVFRGEQSMGTWSVRLLHQTPTAFRVRSTGRLKSGESSMVCSVDVVVKVSEEMDTRPEMGVEHPPLCNGSRHESAAIRVSHIGS
jgi:hypothetical protein